MCYLTVSNHAAIRYYERVHGVQFPWPYLPPVLRREAAREIKTADLIRVLEMVKSTGSTDTYVNGKYPFIKGHRVIVQDDCVVTVV